jgi:hypothetical protein
MMSKNKGASLSSSARRRMAKWTAMKARMIQRRCARKAQERTSHVCERPTSRKLWWLKKSFATNLPEVSFCAMKKAPMTAIAGECLMAWRTRADGTAGLTSAWRTIAATIATPASLARTMAMLLNEKARVWPRR